MSTNVEMIEADRNYVVHPGRPRQLSRTQYLGPRRAGIALATHAADQPLLPGQYQLCSRSEPNFARRFHFGARGRRHRDEQRRISQQGQGLSGHLAHSGRRSLERFTAVPPARRAPAASSAKRCMRVVSGSLCQICSVPGSPLVHTMWLLGRARVGSCRPRGCRRTGCDLPRDLGAADHDARARC